MKNLKKLFKSLSITGLISSSVLVAACANPFDDKYAISNFYNEDKKENIKIDIREIINDDQRASVNVTGTFVLIVAQTSNPETQRLLYGTDFGDATQPPKRMNGILGSVYNNQMQDFKVGDDSRLLVLLYANYGDEERQTDNFKQIVTKFAVTSFPTILIFEAGNLVQSPIINSRLQSREDVVDEIKDRIRSIN
jgi:thioredoxin-related protein